MSLPQHILYNVGGTVSIWAPVRPVATQTVSCYTGGGGEVFAAQDATIEAIDTTLSSAATVGSRSLAVASATGIAAGSTLLLSSFEQVVVKSISGTDVTLRRPLLDSHASGAAAQSCKLSYAVTAEQAATLFWDGRLEWLVDEGEAAETVYHQAAICTKHRFYRAADEADWLDEEPLLYDVLDPNADPDRQLDRALNDVVSRLSALTEGRAWSYVGPDSFKRATVYAAQMNLYRKQAGDDAEQLYERYRAEFQSELERVVAGTAWRDADQDGAVDASEQRSARSMRLYRA